MSASPVRTGDTVRLLDHDGAEAIVGRVLGMQDARVFTTPARLLSVESAEGGIEQVWSDRVEFVR